MKRPRLQPVGLYEKLVIHPGPDETHDRPLRQKAKTIRETLQSGNHGERSGISRKHMVLGAERSSASTVASPTPPASHAFQKYQDPAPLDGSCPRKLGGIPACVSIRHYGAIFGVRPGLQQPCKPLSRRMESENDRVCCAVCPLIKLPSLQLWHRSECRISGFARFAAEREQESDRSVRAQEASMLGPGADTAGRATGRSAHADLRRWVPGTLSSI